MHLDQHATSHWSGYLLLAIYAGTQIASTYFMGATMDKTQRNIMMVLPLSSSRSIARFPTGLMLYWVTTNLWTVGQGLVTRRLVPKTPAPSFGRLGQQPRPKPSPAPAPTPWSRSRSSRSSRTQPRR